MNKTTPVKELKGVGDKTAELFSKLNINNIDDLIHYYPRAYDRYENAVGLKDAVQSERNAIIATVKNTPRVLKYAGKSVVSFFISSDDAVCEVKFFNSPFMAKAVKQGDTRVFRGFLRPVKDHLVMDQPKLYGLEEYKALEGTIVPIYPLIKDMTNDRIRKTVRQALDSIPKEEDYLTEEELKEMSLSSNADALFNIHFPADDVSQYYARRRIVFNEFLDFIALQKESNKDINDIPNGFPMLEVSDVKHLEEQLPYALTNAQKNAVRDIIGDMCGDYLMNRLVQGDVGSGKTIVAIMALLNAAANGYQGALMAPTEVLARQHYENIVKLTKQYGLCFKPCLLVGKMSAVTKRTVLEGIKSGEINVVVGTHAIIQDKVEFSKLALVITDEQHRFGVKQRETLKDKGLEPHLLVMSATPIPRTLAMIVFGGTAVSVIDEMPKNRIPISNCVINSGMRIKAYEKIRSEIHSGHQAYVICPMVYEGDDNGLGLKSVEEHTKDLKEYFGEQIRILSLNGKMKPDEKTRIMEEFKEHKADLLVSTTVIEVGIDVPNATIIMIENSERFGLAQLHQLRGRVGRGNFPSYCILMSDNKSEGTRKRLNILNETNDGFKIASEDMKLRGPGELNGVRQSGELDFGLGDIENDSDIFLLASDKYDVLRKRMPEGRRNLIDFRTI